MREAYGKVSVAQFLRLKQEAEKPMELEETFREDYQIGTNEDGNFFATYTGCCSACGLEHHFEAEERIKL